MSIIITNVTKNPTERGLNEYLIRINETVICNFYHYREDGLSKCLRRAADAIDRAEVRKKDELNMQILKALATADFTKFKEGPQ